MADGKQAHDREQRGQDLLRLLRRRQGLVLGARPSSTTTAGRSRRGSNGKWTGTLDSPRAIAGLNAFKNTFLALSRASKSTDEANPFPTVPFSQGHAASFVGPGWQFGYALDPKAGNPKLKPVMGAFPMPSHMKGRTMPAFLGGSDLAIPASSQNQDLAVDWIADFTANAADEGHRQGGEPPEHDLAAQPGQGHARARRSPQSAKSTWFVPTAKNWTNVESSNVLRTMLTNILTGKQSVHAGGQVGERQDHRRSSTQAPERSRRPRAQCRAIRFPPQQPMPPEQPSGRSGGVAVSTRARVARRSVPYALIAPALIVIVAILGYPLYFLVRLSFQHYGLFQLIAHKGEWVGLDNYTVDPRRQPVLGRRPPHGGLHGRERRPDDGARHADRAPAQGARPRDADRSSPSALVLAWSMPVVVAAQLWLWMTNYENGVLNYVLTKLGFGDFIAVRLVREPARRLRRDHVADRLGRGAVRRDHRLRRADAGAGRAARGGRDRRLRRVRSASATSPSRS